MPGRSHSGGVGGGVLGAGAVGRGHRLAARRVARGRGKVIGSPAHDGQDGQAQRGPGQPAPPERPGRRARAQDNDLLDVFDGPHRRVVLLNQRIRIRSYDMGNGTDMAASVGVTAAGGEVILLDSPDDRFPDAGLAADLAHGQLGPPAGLGQHRADAHPSPPLPWSRPRRLTYQV